MALEATERFDEKADLAAIDYGSSIPSSVTT